VSPKIVRLGQVRSHGGKKAPRGGSAFLKAALVGCCLFAAGSGCLLHRTGHGFILGSRGTLDAHDRGQASAAEKASTASRQADAKPELLPWRNHLKGHRLAARLLHHDSDAAESAPKERDDAPPSGDKQDR